MSADAAIAPGSSWALGLNGEVTLLPGDCLVRMAELEAESLDACVTDPPYHLSSIVERFGKDGSAAAKSGATGAYARASRGFMGQAWDGGDVAFQPDTWRGVYHALKPGAYLAAFSATRTYHRMACAIEDAGFEIRDCILDLVASDAPVRAFLDTLDPEQAGAFARAIEDSQFGGLLAWVFGTGFPKSHDLARGVDQALGAEGSLGPPKSQAHAGWIGRGRMRGDNGMEGFQRPWMLDGEAVERAARQYIPATDQARRWQGWGSALKPAFEPVVLARKPLSERSLARNVLRHGVGGLHIDACRVGSGARASRTGGMAAKASPVFGSFAGPPSKPISTELDRWPANLVHDGSPEVLAAFPSECGEAAGLLGLDESAGVAVSQSAARFFYSAKADRDDRLGSKHPTVKPLELMTWLVQLICPPGGVVLDPFAGTGTTGEAASKLGMRAVLIEREPAYQEDIKRRLALAWAGPEQRARMALAAAGKVKPAEDLPLFEGLGAAP